MLKFFLTTFMSNFKLVRAISSPPSHVSIHNNLDSELFFKKSANQTVDLPSKQPTSIIVIGLGDTNICKVDDQCDL